MSVAAAKLRSPVCEPRSILAPGGNRVKVSEDPKRRNEGLNKPQKPRKPVSETIPESVVRNNVSVDSTCSSDSSSCGSVAKTVRSRKTVRRNGLRRPVKVVPDGVEVDIVSRKPPGPPKRCDWITPNSGKFSPKTIKKRRFYFPSLRNSKFLVYNVNRLV